MGGKYLSTNSKGILAATSRDASSINDGTPLKSKKILNTVRIRITDQSSIQIVKTGLVDKGFVIIQPWWLSGIMNSKFKYRIYSHISRDILDRF